MSFADWTTNTLIEEVEQEYNAYWSSTRVDSVQSRDAEVYEIEQLALLKDIRPSVPAMCRMTRQCWS